MAITKGYLLYVEHTIQITWITAIHSTCLQVWSGLKKICEISLLFFCDNNFISSRFILNIDQQIAEKPRKSSYLFQQQLTVVLLLFIVVALGCRFSASFQILCIFNWIFNVIANWNLLMLVIMGRGKSCFSCFDCRLLRLWFMFYDDWLLTSVKGLQLLY